MVLLLFGLLGVLCLLQAAKYRIPRMILTLLLIASSAYIVYDYQVRVLLCTSEQESIAQLLQRMDPVKNPEMFRTAAHNYFKAIENASADEPFNASFYSFLLEESLKR